MDPFDLSVRLKTLDGQWEEVGAEAVRYRGVWPENLSYSHNDWGDDVASFDLRRDPGAIHPDLSAFTDCEITVCGRLAWSGRVKETPTREGADPVINVQGEGWQYHMDDDQYQRAYVHTRLSEWRDARSFLDTNLAFYTTAFQVEVGDGGIVMGLPRGATCPGFGTASVVLDLGQADAKRVVVVWEGGGHANFGLMILGADSPTGGSESTVIDNAPITTTETQNGATFTTSRRYVEIRMQDAGAGTTAATDTAWVRLKALRVFGDASWESVGFSILRGDQILTDALDRATLLLDPDRSGIVAGVFDEIPEFATSQLVSPREAWNAANAYENYETKIDARRPIFRPRASAPIYETGEWSGAEFEDASANSGAEILSRVFVEGQTAAGERLVVDRWSDGIFERIAQVANPSATVDASGWTAGAGTLSRVAGTFAGFPGSSTGPGYFRLTGSTSGVVTSAAVTQTMRKGARYRYYAGAIQGSFTGSPNTVYMVVLVDGVEVARRLVFRTSGGGSSSFTDGSLSVVEWSQSFDGSNYQLRWEAVGATYTLDWDDVVVERSAATLVDRRGFVKSRTLPIGNRITQASGERLGTLYLDQHRTTPFTGGFKAVGVGGVRRVLGGQAVHPGWLGRDTGQLVRANHVIDPDTGGVGRDERIKTVAYDHNTLTATVSLAEDRGGFDALLAQLAVVVGS